jgi:hypothetical protein
MWQVEQRGFGMATINLGWLRNIFDVRAPAKKLGLLSSITLTSKMENEIATGYGVGHTKKWDGVAKNKLKEKRADLTANTDVIATIGGLFVNTEISDGSTGIPFVSLVGRAPEFVDGNCLGGVSLETVSSNHARRNLLVGRPSIDVVAKIGLYHQDSHSTVADAEVDEWPVPTTIVNSTGTTAAAFAADFTTATNKGIKALVIGASPSFQEKKADLVSAANTWLSGTPVGEARYVVYPLQIYSEANPMSPAATGMRGDGKSILYGHDLYRALRLLGYFARLAVDPGVGWFQPVQNIKTEV